MITLSGENISLRAVEPADLEVLFKWENDPDNWLVSNTLVPFSRHVLEKFIETASLDIYEAKQLRLMIDRRTDTPSPALGCVDLFDFDPYHNRAGVGILIARERDRMKGIATEALGLLAEYAFRKLQMHQLYCNITEGNQASLKLFQKHGFEVTGRRKDWVRAEEGWKEVLFLQLINPYPERSSSQPGM